jgi:hypothetical protein
MSDSIDFNKMLLDGISYGDNGLEEVKKAIDNGVTPNQLHVCKAIKAGATEIVKYLIENGVNPNGICIDRSFVQLAIDKHAIGILRFLIEKGVDIKKNRQEFPPIVEMLTMENPSADIFELLVKNGAIEDNGTIDKALVEVLRDKISYERIGTVYEINNDLSRILETHIASKTPPQPPQTVVESTGPKQVGGPGCSGGSCMPSWPLFGTKKGGRTRRYKNKNNKKRSVKRRPKRKTRKY